VSASTLTWADEEEWAKVLGGVELFRKGLLYLVKIFENGEMSVWLAVMEVFGEIREMSLEKS
jgi:hypothetical protein